jgi:archaellum component FlaC
MDDELLNRISTEIGELKGIMTGVRDDLQNGKDRFKDIERRETERHNEVDERIRMLEQQQQWMSGKLAAFVMAIGAGVTLLIHAAMWLYDKVRFNH